MEDVITLKYVECVIIEHPKRVVQSTQLSKGHSGAWPVTLCGSVHTCHSALWNKYCLVEIVIMDSSEEEK